MIKDVKWINLVQTVWSVGYAVPIVTSITDARSVRHGSVVSIVSSAALATWARTVVGMCIINAFIFVLICLGVYIPQKNSTLIWRRLSYDQGALGWDCNTTFAFFISLWDIIFFCSLIHCFCILLPNADLHEVVIVWNVSDAYEVCTDSYVFLVVQKLSIKWNLRANKVITV